PTPRPLIPNQTQGPSTPLRYARDDRTVVMSDDQLNHAFCPCQDRQFQTKPKVPRLRFATLEMTGQWVMSDDQLNHAFCPRQDRQSYEDAVYGKWGKAAAPDPRHKPGHGAIGHDE